MKNLILTFTFIFWVSFLVQAQKTEGEIKNKFRDSVKIPLNEVGIYTSLFTFNSFAPEWYLKCFNSFVSQGIFYKRDIGQTTVRFGYSRSSQTITSIGGSWREETKASGNESGSVFYVGFQKDIFTKRIFRLYAGADAAAANFSFNGYCHSYDGLKCYNKRKEMLGTGINPFAGCSIILFKRMGVSIESGIDCWRIREKDFITDPAGFTTKHSFSISPNPLNKISISFLF